MRTLHPVSCHRAGNQGREVQITPFPMKKSLLLKQGLELREASGCLPAVNKPRRPGVKWNRSHCLQIYKADSSGHHVL